MSEDLRELACKVSRGFVRQVSPDVERLRESLNEGLGRRALDSYAEAQKQTVVNAEFVRDFLKHLPQVEYPQDVSYNVPYSFIAPTLSEVKFLQSSLIWCRDDTHDQYPYWVVGERQTDKVGYLLLHAALSSNGIPKTGGYDDNDRRGKPRPIMRTIEMQNKPFRAYKKSVQAWLGTLYAAGELAAGRLYDAANGVFIVNGHDAGSVRLAGYGHNEDNIR